MIVPGFTDGTQVAANVGRVMKPTGTGFTAPLATEEEIAAGRFFENVGAIDSAHGGFGEMTKAVRYGTIAAVDAAIRATKNVGS